MNNNEWDISICGLNCAKCEIFLNNQCSKCRGPLDKHWSPDCEFIECINQKKLKYCYECEYFPCKKIKKFENDEYPHHRQTINNLTKMKEIGIEAFIKDQKRAVFCPK